MNHYLVIWHQPNADEVDPDALRRDLRPFEVVGVYRGHTEAEAVENVASSRFHQSGYFSAVELSTFDIVKSAKKV